MLKWIGRIFLLWCTGGILAFVWFAMPHMLHSTSRAANFAELLLVSLALEIAQFTTIGAMMMGRRTTTGLPRGSATDLWKARKQPSAARASVPPVAAQESYPSDIVPPRELISQIHNLLREGVMYNLQRGDEMAQVHATDKALTAMAILTRLVGRLYPV